MNAAFYERACCDEPGAFTSGVFVMYIYWKIHFDILSACWTIMCLAADFKAAPRICWLHSLHNAIVLWHKTVSAHMVLHFVGVSTNLFVWWRAWHAPLVIAVWIPGIATRMPHGPERSFFPFCAIARGFHGNHVGIYVITSEVIGIGKGLICTRVKEEGKDLLVDTGLPWKRWLIKN